MPLSDDNEVLAKVPRALGRSAVSIQPPAPPEIPESIARMVRRDADLAEVFAKGAKEQKILLTRTSGAEVAKLLVEFLRSHPIKRVALSVWPRLNRLGIPGTLRKAGFDAAGWTRIRDLPAPAARTFHQLWKRRDD